MNHSSVIKTWTAELEAMRKSREELNRRSVMMACDADDMAHDIEVLVSAIQVLKAYDKE